MLLAVSRVKELNVQIVVDLVVFALRVHVLADNAELFGLAILIF